MHDNEQISSNDMMLLALDVDFDVFAKNVLLSTTLHAILVVCLITFGKL